MVILAADKETCTVILNKSDHIKKVNNIIEEGTQGKDIETIDITHDDVKHQQDFLYRHSRSCSVSNQSGRYFATAKRRKFPS